jgi:hypothetical protein
LDDIPPRRAYTILDVLLDSIVDVNSRDADGRTPLLWAASCGNTRAVFCLSRAGADKTIVDRDNLNVLHCAANHGYVDTVDFLIRNSNRKLMDGKVSFIKG